MKILGHRGYAKSYPENTLLSLQKGIELSDGVEFDVQVCATGQLVLLHDTTLDRTTSGKGSVHEASWEELSKLDAGSWKDPSFRGLPLPLLSEILHIYQGKTFLNIEIKSQGSDLRDQCLLDEFQTLFCKDSQPSDILVTSFDFSILKKLRNVLPKIPLGLLLETDAGTSIAQDRNFLKTIEEMCPTTLVPHHSLYTQDNLSHWKDTKCILSCYTVNDPIRMKELQAWGVDVLITDDPKLARETLFP